MSIVLIVKNARKKDWVNIRVVIIENKSFAFGRAGNITPALPEGRRNDIMNMKHKRVKGICFDKILNNYIEVPFVEISKPNLYKLKKSKWNFNWFVPMQNGYKIYALVVENEEIQGLIALKPDYDNQSIAIDIVEGAQSNIGSTGKLKIGGSLFGLAAFLSFQMGFDGYVYFDAKSELAGHYREKYRAVQIGNSQRMVFDTQASRELINTYIKEV